MLTYTLKDYENEIEQQKCNKEITLFHVCIYALFILTPIVLILGLAVVSYFFEVVR